MDMGSAAAEYERALRLIDQMVNGAIVTELEKTRHALQQFTPVRTGRMKANYTIHPDGTGVELANQMFYSTWVIDGMPGGRPYRKTPQLRPIIDKEAARIEAVILSTDFQAMFDKLLP
jgi:hypothetical protein